MICRSEYTGRYGDFYEKRRRCVHKKRIWIPEFLSFMCLLHVHFQFVIQQQSDNVTLNSHISINLCFPSNKKTMMPGSQICQLPKLADQVSHIFMFAANLLIGMFNCPMHRLQCLPTIDTLRVKTLHFCF